MNDTRQLVREELAMQKARDDFWARLHADFPITRGHRELAQTLLRKHMAKMADMTTDEGREFLGEALTREIDRRKLRDEHNRESMIYEGGPGGSHGHSIDARTGERIEVGDQFDEVPTTFGDMIKGRREARRNAEKRYSRSPEGDKRERGYR